ncbi:MAG: hypothetical protein ACYCVX_10580 [Thiobacillus sp.]
MIKLGKISPLAFSRMKQRGISIAALHRLLAHGQVEKQFDGARVVYLDSDAPVPGRQPAAQALCGGGCGRRRAHGGKTGAAERLVATTLGSRLERKAPNGWSSAEDRTGAGTSRAVRPKGAVSVQVIAPSRIETKAKKGICQNQVADFALEAARTEKVLYVTH